MIAFLRKKKQADSSNEASDNDDTGADAEPAVRRPWYLYLWQEWARPILIVVVIAGIFRSSVADWHDVPTGSMEPTILIGDRIAVNKLAYDLKIPFTRVHLGEWGDPARGDIVVFYEPEHDQRYIKRVVGLPGDVIEMHGNRLTINHKPIEYEPREITQYPVSRSERAQPLSFAVEFLTSDDHPVMTQGGRMAKRDFGPIEVPAGHYFMMGDNRDNSKDSRYFGFIARDRIVGRAFGVAISFREKRVMDPRWDRFFQPFE